MFEFLVEKYAGRSLFSNLNHKADSHRDHCNIKERSKQRHSARNIPENERF